MTWSAVLIRCTAAVVALAAPMALIGAAEGRTAFADPAYAGAADHYATCRDSDQNVIPVLLVHGWMSSAAAWKKQVHTLGAQSGTCIDTFDYGPEATEWVTNPKIGTALARRIASLSARAAGGKVIVVGHSLGGLAVRCAASPSCGGDSSTASRLLDVVMMGTPNHGTFLKAYGVSNLSNVLIPLITSASCGAILGGAPASPCAYLLSVVTSPAAYAFTPGSKQLTALPSLPRSVPVRAVAGSVRLTTSFFGNWEETLGNAGDLVVSHESAFASANKVGSLGGTETIDCGTLNITGTTGGLGTLCWHGGQPGDDQFAVAGLKEIGRAVASVEVTRPDLRAAPVPALRGNPAGNLRDGVLPNPSGNGLVQLEIAGGAAPALGDLTGDGFRDAAAVIAATSGAGGMDYVMTVYTKVGGKVVLRAMFDPARAVEDAQHAEVTGMTISDRMIHLTWSTWGFGPDFLERRWSADLRLEGDQLRMTGLHGDGPPSSSDAVATCEAFVKAAVADDVDALAALMSPSALAAWPRGTDWWRASDHCALDGSNPLRSTVLMVSGPAVAGNWAQIFVLTYGTRSDGQVIIDELRSEGDAG